MQAPAANSGSGGEDSGAHEDAAALVSLEVAGALDRTVVLARARVELDAHPLPFREVRLPAEADDAAAFR